MNRNLLHVVSVIGLMTAGTANAGYYQLMNGRSADLSKLPQTSVEAGAVFGDLYEADYQYLGVRLNYKLSPELMVYGDLGQVEIELGGGDADGTSFGAGGFYVLEGALANTDLAIRGSYHKAGLEGDGGGEADFTELSVDAVFSGREGLGANKNIGWYANVGYNKLDFDDFSDDETEIGFGGGIVVPSASGQGEFFAGIDLIDEMIFGAGYRFFLQ